MEKTTWRCAQKPEPLLNWIHERMLGAKHVEAVDRPAPDRIVVTASAYPSWTIAVAILLFPVGLLALLARRRGTLQIWAEADPDGGTQLHLAGFTTPGVMSRLIEIYKQLEGQGTIRSQTVSPSA